MLPLSKEEGYNTKITVLTVKHKCNTIILLESVTTTEGGRDEEAVGFKKASKKNSSNQSGQKHTTYIILGA